MALRRDPFLLFKSTGGAVRMATSQTWQCTGDINPSPGDVINH